MSTDDTLADRLSFIKLDAAAQADIRGVKTTIMRNLPAALDRFYGQVRAFPETSGFFTNADLLNSAKSRQLHHWEAISSGQFDHNYLRAVTAVGEVHARIGLEPRWYIGGYALVLESLITSVLEARWPKAHFGSKGAGVGQVAAELGALAKATLLDMDLAISVYLEASERARRAVEDEARSTNEAVMHALGDALAALADGDLTYRISEEMPGDYARLRGDFNSALEHLAETMAQIRRNTDGINVGVDEIAAASDDLSRRTEHQAASLEQTAAALDQITATVKKTALGGKQANDAVSKANDAASNSHDIVSKAVAAMGQIETSSQEISQIISVIDEIAFQTNLLALNAGVEAARAGDAGRGFAVVASEVRALAQRSAQAAKEIKALITTSSGQVAEGVTLVGETGQALRLILANVSQIDGLVAEIAASALEQATGLNEVNTAVNQMDQVVQQNAAMVEQSTAAAHSLKSETAALARSVAAFKIEPSGGTRPDPSRSVSTRRPSAPTAIRKQAAGAGGRVSGARPDGWEEF